MSPEQRFIEMDEKEQDLHKLGYNYICGIDEVGRGPLAGPLVVAGVILDKPILGLRDSKKLSHKKIVELNSLILDNCYNYYISVMQVSQIEEHGIKGALKLAMQEITQKINADYFLVDYEKIDLENSESITKGDDKCNCIAAASIIAKYHRDNLMKDIAKKHPEYGFESNVGYGTKKHLEAITKFGYINGIHRRNFNPVKTLIEEENAQSKN